MLRFVCSNSKCGRRFKTEQASAPSSAACPSCGSLLQAREAAAGVSVGSGNAGRSHSLRDLVDTGSATGRATGSREFVSFACEHCDALCYALAEKLGQTVLCPKCRRKTQITAVGTLALATPASRQLDSPPNQDRKDSAQAAAEVRAKRLQEAEEAKRRQAEEHARQVAAERSRREQQARLEAEERAREEAVKNARREAEEKARLDAEARTKREAQERAKREAAAQAARAAEEQRRREAEERARQVAAIARREEKETARREAEARATREAAERAKREAAAQAVRAAQEQRRLEHEERLKHEAVLKARREAEENARQESEARAKREAEKRAKAEADERARREGEQRAKQEAEQAQRRTEERTRLEDEQDARWLATVESVKHAEAVAGTPSPSQVADLLRSGDWLRNRFRRPVDPLFSQPLGLPLWGIRLGADLYAKNGFRFLRIPASASPAEVDAQTESLHERWARNRKSAEQSFISVGYEPAVKLRQIGSHLAELKQPRARLVRELFWPHVAGEEFGAVLNVRSVSSWHVFQAFAAASRGRSGLDRILCVHAQAVAAHCLAMTWECGFAAGFAAGVGRFWRMSMECWEEIVASDQFWAYFQKRAISALGSKADVEELRENLPLVLLGFHSLLAQAYARAGDDHACQRHLSLLQQSPLTEASCPDADRATVVAAYW